MGLFGNMFDMNQDGKMDTFEKAAELASFAMIMDCIDEGVEDPEVERITELQEAGLNPEELEFMDEDTRRDVLESAGLDPDAFDF